MEHKCHAVNTDCESKHVINAWIVGVQFLDKQEIFST
jgi:hypothetical protein